MALKVGIIGNGGIANSHMHGYLALGDRVEVVACCDINFEKAKEFAARYNIPNVYDNCYDMLRCNKLDMADVCTWNAAHCECTVTALNAGVNVLCEKPMAMNAVEAQRMYDAAKASGKLLMLGFVRRQGDDAKRAVELINDGTVGDVYFAKATYLRRCGFPGGWFGNKALSGGGPLIDLGVHVIDLTRYIMGCPRPVSVYGAAFNKLGARENVPRTGWASETVVEKPVFNVEDLAVAMIRFDNGAVLEVECSFNLNLKNEKGDIEFFGTKAGFSLNEFELHTEVGHELADLKLYGDHRFEFQRDMDREIKNFADAVEGKAPCLANAEDGVILMKILDAIYRSAETGRSVEIQ